MGRRYYNYRVRHGRYWAARHASQRAALRSTFYGLDADVTEIFYSLDGRQFARMLVMYGDRYGASARSYAEKTYPKWRDGAVQPSAETLRRLLDSVPAVLPLELRAQLLARLRQRSRRLSHEYLRCAPDEAVPATLRALARIFDQGLRHEVPPHVKDALAWLSCDSMREAETILRIGEVLEARLFVAATEAEVCRLRAALDRAAGIERARPGRFSHTVQTPHGTVGLTVGERTWIEKVFTSISTQPQTMSDLTPRRPDDLLNELTRQLSDADRVRLRQVAAQNQLDLDVKTREASLAHAASGAEIDRTLDAAERLAYGEKTSSFAVSGTHRGASGTTTIEVKRSEPAAMMYKWAAVGAAIVGALWLLVR